MLVIVVPIDEISCPPQRSMKLRFFKSECCCASIQIGLSRERRNCGRLCLKIETLKWTRARSQNKAYDEEDKDEILREYTQHDNANIHQEK
jgi:hypothetical protein